VQYCNDAEYLRPSRSSSPEHRNTVICPLGGWCFLAGQNVHEFETMQRQRRLLINILINTPPQPYGTYVTEDVSFLHNYLSCFSVTRNQLCLDHCRRFTVER
jgi:hypothetical protein